MRVPSCVWVAIVCVAGCSADATAPSSPAAGTYYVDTIDHQFVPFVVSQDSSCTTINSGGWITLFGDGRYELALSRVSELCSGVISGGSMLLQHGTFELTGTQVTFAPSGAQGSAFEATFTPPGTLPGNTYRLPSLVAEFQGRRYELFAVAASTPALP